MSIVVEFENEVDRDIMQLLTKNQVWSLLKTCQLLMFALAVDKVKMLICQDWDALCKEVIGIGWQVGVMLSKCLWTLCNYGTLNFNGSTSFWSIRQCQRSTTFICFWNKTNTFTHLFHNMP